MFSEIFLFFEHEVKIKAKNTIIIFELPDQIEEEADDEEHEKF